MQISSLQSSQGRARIVVPLLLLAAGAWIVTITWAREMGGMPGTMGMGMVPFVAMWTFMMAAMMLPSASPLVGIYMRTLQIQRYRQLALFVAGYVLVWSLSGVPAFGLAWIADRVAADQPGWATGAAVAIFATCGLYQLTPLKDRCLHHCRTPLGHFLHYGSYRGVFRNLRAGSHHGMFCLGCCWSLMLLMVAFGMMNLVAMVGLASVVALEKQWSHGEKLAKAAGVISLALAVAVVFFPELAPGFHADTSGGMDGMTM